MDSSEKQNVPMESAPPYEEVIRTAPRPNYPAFGDQMMMQNPNGYVGVPIQNAPIAQQPAVMQTVNVGGASHQCTFCHKPLRTVINHHSTCCTHMACLGLILTGVCCPLALYVYCTPCCREPRVECASCGNPA